DVSVSAYSALPFDLGEVTRNLRLERYRNVEAPARRLSETEAARSAYYLLRPILPVSVRKHLQRIRLSDWKGIVFPSWPVDVTVDLLMQRQMENVLHRSRAESVPFIWFWPEGAGCAAMMTHDVEGP